MTQMRQQFIKFIHRGPKSFRGWILLTILAPLGALYGIVGYLRLTCYRHGFLSMFQTTIPVISVGNLAAGGKGKTPLVDYIARFLSSRGKRVAVVSRGYGGVSKDSVSEVRQADYFLQAAKLYGDEPALLQRRNPDIVVITAKKRAMGIAHAQKACSAEVVVLDDGFQHLAVDRSLDILMLDARQPFGNGWPLPAGELREFAPAYRRADMLVLSRCGSDDRLPPYFSGPVIRTSHRLEDHAVDLDGGRCSLVDLHSKSGVAFSGIASPEIFFSDLATIGLSLIDEIVLPDHVVYDQQVLKQLNRRATGADFLVTTEKDGVKLTADMFPIPCYQVPLRLEVCSGAELLDEMLASVIAKGSTMNVSEDLLEILACPKCKGTVVQNEDKSGIVCRSCQLVYPVRDDIPVMLIDEATPI